MNLTPELRRISRLIGLDRPVLFILLSRMWSTLAGVMTLYMIARYLRPDEQGFYYTFSSILGMQIFFELGFSATLLQCVSHEKAHLEWTVEGRLGGVPHARLRLATLLRVALRWYGAAAILSFCVVLPAGLAFFRQPAAGHHSSVIWRGPWIWLACAEAIMLFTSPFFVLLEGAGLVAQVALVRLTTSVLTTLALWTALWRGWALFASPVVTTVSIVCSCTWLGYRWKNCFADLLRTPHTGAALDWRREVWPFQWRITVNWLSYYFMSQLAVPVLFRYWGPVAAGQFGLSVSVTLAAQAVGLAWITTKAPIFGVYVARGEFQALDDLFFRTLKQALSVLALMAFALWLGVILISVTGSSYKNRIVTPLPFVFLLGKMLLDCTAYFLAVYLRAHKQEPLLAVSLLNAVLVASSTFIIGRFWGAGGVAAGNFFAVLLTLPIVVTIFGRKRRLWHAVPAPACVV